MEPNPQQFPANPLFDWYKSIVAQEGQDPNHMLDKSALYQRLLKGGLPLVAPPPLAYSYPWYAVVENDDPISIHNPPESWEQDTSQVIIAQSAWKVLSRTDNELVVTYRGWEERGFTWRIWSSWVSATESQSTLVCHHDREHRRITTEMLLDAECLHHAHVWRKALTIAASDLPDGDKINELIGAEALVSGSRNFLLAAGRQQLVHLGAALVHRRDQGLPDEPGDDEVQAEAERYRAMLLRDRWDIIDGLLYHQEWFMQRATPTALGPEFYLSRPGNLSSSV